MRRHQRWWDTFGNLGVVLILSMVGVQAFRWLNSPPAYASTLRYSLVLAQLIVGFGLALAIAALCVFRFRRAAGE